MKLQSKNVLFSKKGHKNLGTLVKYDTFIGGSLESP